MDKDGNDSDGLGDAHPAPWESKLTKADEVGLDRNVPFRNTSRFNSMKKSQAPWSVQTATKFAYTKPCSRPASDSFLFPLSESSFITLSASLAPNACRILHSCMVLWPLVQGKENQLTMKKFLHLYRIQKNPKSSGVYNFQTKRGKFI
jgi:hypothetical protein